MIEESKMKKAFKRLAKLGYGLAGPAAALGIVFAVSHTVDAAAADAKKPAVSAPKVPTKYEPVSQSMAELLDGGTVVSGTADDGGGNVYVANANKLYVCSWSRPNPGLINGGTTSQCYALN
ncbi:MULTISPECIES: hypothetical protein [unclassified Acetobacter]